MSDLDLDAMTLRFRQRAEAVRGRTMPPVTGAERLAFVAQAKVDFQDFAIVGDAEANLDDGILTLRVDLRPPKEPVNGTRPSPAGPANTGAELGRPDAA